LLPRSANVSTRLQRDGGSVDDWLLLGRGYASQGKFSEAKTWQEKAIAAGGDKEAVLIEHYGDILFKLGDSAGAVVQWKKAKDLGGASELIGRKITEGKLVE